MHKATVIYNLSMDLSMLLLALTSRLHSSQLVWNRVGMECAGSNSHEVNDGDGDYDMLACCLYFDCSILAHTVTFLTPHGENQRTRIMVLSQRYGASSIHTSLVEPRS